jgi:hypothetical protein
MKEFTVGGKPRLQKAFAEVLKLPVSGGYEKEYPFIHGSHFSEDRTQEYISQSFDKSDTHFELPDQWDEAMAYARAFYGIKADQEVIYGMSPQLKPKEEKPPLPESWGDLPQDDSYVLVTKKADIYDAFCMLYDLRQAYWQAHDNWRPDWTDANQTKYVAVFDDGELTKQARVVYQCFIAMPTEAYLDHFLKHHKALIEQARELL